MPRNRIPHPIELRQEVGRLKSEGKSVPEIAFIHDMDQAQVRGILSSLAKSSNARSRRARNIEPKVEKKCLTHGGMFMSEGPHNRICPACSHSIKYNSHIAGDYSLAGLR